MSNLGITLNRLERRAEARVVLEAALLRHRALGNVGFECYTLHHLAASVPPIEGLQHLAAAQLLADELGSVTFQSMIRRHRGDLAAQVGDLAAAEVHLRASIALLDPAVYPTRIAAVQARLDHLLASAP